MSETRAEKRAEIIDGLVEFAGATREQLESLSDEEFFTTLEVFQGARENVRAQIASGELRRVTLSGGRGFVLVDGDCGHTDEEIRAALEGANDR